MGRRARAQRLNIWMNGILVGSWETTRQGERLDYFEEWLTDEQSRPLSLSLPFLPGNAPYQGQVVTDYFDNLLPDNDAIRRRLAQRHLAGGIDPFHLLAKLGRDCVGAIQLLPEDEAPSDVYEINGDTLNTAGIAQRLRNITSAQALGQHDHDEDLRLSIAGAQEKTALLRHEGLWFLPHGSTPTTHIFKLPLGLVGHMQADMRTSVENEWMCSKIMEAYEIPIARCEIEHFEEQKALVVERFDRTPSSDGSWIIRLPQEDMCQATATSPLHKYQSDGGPGIAQIMELLLGSDNAEQDRNHFFKTQIVFWVLAATDGHGKNFSIAHLPGGSYHATPIYDVLSAHPVIGTGRNQISPHKAKLAMAVRGSSNYYLIDGIQRRHWIAQAQQVGLGAAAAEQLIEEVVESTETVIGKVGKLLPDDFPMDVAEAVFSGMRRQSAKLGVNSADFNSR
ncbi:MAG: type II toxin-antitoxin system HipA family toxin [Thiobacillus sp.]|nr:type II toxin-antitoxin system HipA family toxin [Thiobacillus sp.]